MVSRVFAQKHSTFPISRTLTRFPRPSSEIKFRVGDYLSVFLFTFFYFLMYRNSAKNSAFSLLTVVLLCIYGAAISATFFYNSLFFGFSSLIVAVILLYVRQQELKRRFILYEQVRRLDEERIIQAIQALLVSEQSGHEKAVAKKSKENRNLVKIQSPYNTNNLLPGFPPICLN